jgi:hypothetical protein
VNVAITVAMPRRPDPFAYKEGEIVSGRVRTITCGFCDHKADRIRFSFEGEGRAQRIVCPKCRGEVMYGRNLQGGSREGWREQELPPPADWRR